MIRSMYKIIAHKITAFLAVLYCGLAIAPSLAAERVCTPDVGWPDVPAAIRQKLADSVGGAVSPQGGPFNPTDVMDSIPNARFFGACHAAEQWTVALERGGIAYYLQVFRFSDGVLIDKWTAHMPTDRRFAPDLLVKPMPADRRQ